VEINYLNKPLWALAVVLIDTTTPAPTLAPENNTAGCDYKKTEATLDNLNDLCVLSTAERGYEGLQ
jgi:hypothetical protein